MFTFCKQEVVFNAIVSGPAVWREEKRPVSLGLLRLWKMTQRDQIGPEIERLGIFWRDSDALRVK